MDIQISTVYFVTSTAARMFYDKYVRRFCFIVHCYFMTKITDVFYGRAAKMFMPVNVFIQVMPATFKSLSSVYHINFQYTFIPAVKLWA